MMEVEQLAYIFGSFARRKHHQEAETIKSQSLITAHSTKADGIGGGSNKLKCQLCDKHFIEPRVLPCLHSFCSNCLQALPTFTSTCIVSTPDAPPAIVDCDSSSGSGPVVDKLENVEGEYVECPTCQSKAEMPSVGIAGFPMDYLILHRIVLATLNSPNTKLLCDLCPFDVIAKARCVPCALSLCRQCVDAHAKLKPAWYHEILTLDEARKRGISKVRRQVMCHVHPESELSIFCATCCQVVCADCMRSTHRSHTFEAAESAAIQHSANIRIAVNRTSMSTRKSQLICNQLQSVAERIEDECKRIESEIERFTASYIRAVEEHRSRLFVQLRQAQREKLHAVAARRNQIQQQHQHAEEAIRFANDLLREGSDIEVLHFVSPIMTRLKECCRMDSQMPDLGKLIGAASLQFLPEEVSTGQNSCCPLYGVISTQPISAQHCFLHTNGLQNLSIGQRAEAALEARDACGKPLKCTGEDILAEVKYLNGGKSRTLPVHAEDQRDGFYLLHFVPDVAGKLFLYVSVKGEPLKDSPFTIHVRRSSRPHRGTFHCCTFCASGGSKDATCGCKGRMPGGYKGCGHGHDGHPGRRHWSCCGDVRENSECVRINSIWHYQFSL